MYKLIFGHIGESAWYLVPQGEKNGSGDKSNLSLITSLEYGSLGVSLLIETSQRFDRSDSKLKEREKVDFG